MLKFNNCIDNDNNVHIWLEYETEDMLAKYDGIDSFLGSSYEDFVKFMDNIDGRNHHHIGISLDVCDNIIMEYHDDKLFIYDTKVTIQLPINKCIDALNEMKEFIGNRV